MSKTFITGWDIGGAHVKVARTDLNGHIAEVTQIPCALWKGLHELENAIEKVCSHSHNLGQHHAITMTGELVDLFDNRAHGVSEIINCMSKYFGEDNLSVYSDQGWLTANNAKASWSAVASMNWHASATLCANKVKNGLFIDIGSTTCDIIPIQNYEVSVSGKTDLTRQTSKELLYTGAIRTPLIALCQSAPFNGQQVSLAAEVFATSGDCWLLLNELTQADIQDQSADGQSWNKKNCMTRIARLLGTDVDTAQEQQWLNIATWFAEQQLQSITDACLQVMSQLNNPPTQIIGAGIGRFMVKEVARRLNVEYQDLHLLLGSTHTEISDHAPAAAVALLAAEQFT
jgi:probable H4MPT-linked C1 transfer pathway protein